MPEPIFFRIADDYAPASNTDDQFRLPTFPLSYLNISVRTVQPSANAEQTLSDIVGWISRIAVYVRGASVFDLSGLEAFIVGAMLYCKHLPLAKRPLSATTSRHIANIYVPFSRKPLMPTSGIKQVAHGESLLYMRFGTVPANARISIAAVGWRENAPEWTVKTTRYSQSVAATGAGDLILAPVGPILGLIFHEDNPQESADTTLLSELRFLIQGVEDTLVSYENEFLFGDTALTTYVDFDLTEHAHIENTAASYTQNAVTRSNQAASQVLQRYRALLLDELYDPDAVIAVPPGADVRLRYNATATGTLTVILVEMFVIPERAPAGVGA